jgi:hypothetical protein
MNPWTRALPRRQLPFVIAAFAGILGTWGCSGPTDSGASGARSTSALPPPTSAPQTPDVPAANASTGGGNAVAPTETAKASDPAMEPMTKKQESTAMPMPAQANDHSTVVKDGKK